MNISFSEIIEYWDIITKYLNPLNIILWGIAGIIVGILVMAVVQILLRKKILVRRRHTALKVLAYSYMVLLPLWAGYSFMQWFALHGCEREIVRNIPTYLGEANSMFNTHLKLYVTDLISERHLELTGHEIIDKTVDYAGALVGSAIQTTETDENNIKAKVSNILTAKFVMSPFFKNKIVNRIEEEIGKPLLMDKELTKEFLDVKIQNLMDDGVINTIITKHVEKLFGSFKMNVLIMFLLILIIPAAEILLAHYLERKRLPPPIPGK